MFSTRDLAVYAAVVATISGTWSLYAGVFLDRARVRVRVWEASGIVPGTDATLPMLMLGVSNRGRRHVTIQSIARVVDMRRRFSREVSRDFTLQVPKRLEEGEGHSFVHGGEGGYTLGALPLKRWYVVDGAGRIHPLRERWRQRAESVIFWPWRRRDRQSGSGE